MRKPFQVPRGTLILAGLVVLVAFSISLYNVVDKVDKALFTAQWREKVSMVNLFCDEVDRYVVEDGDWGDYDYTALMRAQVHDMRMDAWPSLFASLYDDEFNLLTDRMDNPVEPLIVPLSDNAVYAAVLDGDRGELSTVYHGENSEGEVIRVYYRWVPSGDGYDHKILFIITMREKPYDNAPSAMLVRWCVLLIAVTGVINLAAGISYASGGKGKVVRNA
ncbi:hypothetical protein AGMMS49992_29760 [Clostridia bacterium]|nr:hypothetical protein AGMMS49992_29760 [Clostridia bacterium]